MLIYKSKQLRNYGSNLNTLNVAVMSTEIIIPMEYMYVYGVYVGSVVY